VQVQSYARKGRRGRFVIVCLAVLALGFLGAALGAARATSDASSQAASLSAAGNYGAAIALENAIASRSGPLYFFDRSDVDAAPRRAQSTFLQWAGALSRLGRSDQAAALLAAVTDPHLLDQAATQRAMVLMQAAQQDAGRGNFSQALMRLDQLRSLHPPASVLQQVNQLTPEYEIGAAMALTASGDGIDAVALLDQAVATAPSAAQAAAHTFPAALLAAGRQQLALHSYKEAVAAMQRLVSDFSGSVEAATARDLMSQPQPVTGTLVDKTGHGVSSQVRLSSHYFSTPGGYYTTGPFYYATSDANGDFTFDAVPQGGPYTFEVFRDGQWVTFVDPGTGQPSNPVTVTPLSPVNLTFISLPA
jgi:tetratricopeptide (TPR) repeat protein